MSRASANNEVGLEVCAASVEDAVVAAQAGACRVELNVALELGGLTPSIGLVERTCLKLRGFDCPVIAMVRPRPGGFAYDSDARDTMRADIDRLLAAGVGGIALGVLYDGGVINEQACAELIAPVLAAEKEAVFHRAFDLTPEPVKAIEQLIGLGFHRVLTSGGAPTALAGAETIAKLIKRADGRIAVLPGSGIRPGNVAELFRRTGCLEVHASLRAIREDRSASANPSLSFHIVPASSAAYGATDAARVAEMLQVLRGG